MQASAKTISIIVPVYNQSQYLPICLDSIWFQDYPALEIIVVNDGSTDDICKALEDYLKGPSWLEAVDDQMLIASIKTIRAKNPPNVWLCLRTLTAAVRYAVLYSAWPESRKG